MGLPILQPQPAPRCTGRCCREFVLTRSYAEAADDFEKWWNGEHHVLQEIEKVFPMLVRLEASAVRLGNGQPYEDGKAHERFTCNAFDQVTGNCRNYANRPELCRAHGVTTHCDHWGHGCELPEPPRPTGLGLGYADAVIGHLQRQMAAEHPRDPSTLKAPE